MAIARKPRKRGDDARNVSLNIWLSPAEKAALKERAGALPVSVWLRALALGQPVRAALSPHRGRVNAIDAVMAPLLREVARIGNNLNQLARQVNSNSIAGNAIDAVELLFALATIGSEVSAILKEVRRACENLSARSD